MSEAGTEPGREAIRLIVESLGDSALLARLSGAPFDVLFEGARSLAAGIGDAHMDGVEDIVLAYSSVAVHFDVNVADPEQITELLLAAKVGSAKTIAGREHVISVRYDGVDLADVAQRTGLTADEVIARHSGRIYRVHALGFVPGFAYLGELDEALRLPRLDTPRVRVPAGAVAIAGSQTAVYPLQTSGGWHLIGNTGTRMFDAGRSPPTLLAVGDTVRFVRG